ncbi:hypothetical protein V8C34DRAFT_171260 [Trichoderma compactum]
MSVSSDPPSSSDSQSTYHRPSHRKDFQIAIICALSLEYDAATLIVDEFWDQDGKQYGRTSGDTNIYRNGRIGMHNVVLMLLPNMGKAAVAGSAASLRTSYSNLRITFLVGICGGIPIVGAREALLGDVAIGEAIIQYDFGRQYPGQFIPKETAVATQSLPNKDIRTLLAYFKSDTGKTDLRQNTARHLKALQGAAILMEHQNSYRYPGFAEDKLFEATYRHKHRGGPPGDSCCDEPESYCDDAAQSSCYELGCDEKKLVQRQRLERKRYLSFQEAQCPDIFIGRVASADIVMKSGDHRDQIAKQYDIIAFEMEGAGLWDECPCIVVKGICDYSDSHKNKIWQPFAAATAAAAVKAMLARYTIEDYTRLSTSSSGSTQLGQIVLARHDIAHYSAQNPASISILGTTKSNGTQTLRDSIFNFQRVLTDDQRRELQKIKMIPDTIAVLVFTAELDSLNRNRKGRSIASRLHSVLQSVRDFSAAVEAADSVHLEFASTLWGSVKLTMLVIVKSATYDDALSKFFMELGGFCPRWTDYQIYFSSSTRLQDALCGFYALLIRCCKGAVEAAQPSWSGYLFSSPREAFESHFQRHADDIKRHSKIVKDELLLAKREAYQQNQQLQRVKKGGSSKKEKLPRVFRGKRDRHDKMESWQAQSDERQAKERKQRLLDSWSIQDYLTPFKQSCRKRYSGTLEWLFHTDEFNMWINNREFPLLWCSGKIGSGKTILTASVIEKLLTEKRSPDVFISFFFIRFDDRQSLTAEVILKSIIRQMLDVSHIYERVETLLDNMQFNLASGLEEIAKLLQSIAEAFKTLYIILDGLDECPKPERHDLLDSLHSVVNVSSNTKLFFAGRDSVSREVQKRFPALKQIPMECPSAQSDITMYVEGIVQEKLKTEELIVGDPNLIEDIKAVLSDGANGMFLWVVFQVNELCLQHCDEDIRTAIRNFPRDLEETFNRAIDRIVSRGNQDIAKRIFRWVAAVKEPLSLDQLEEIVFVEIGQEYSKTERQSNGIAHISSWCENLVRVDEELKTVQFVHQTVQQFFIERTSKSRNHQFYLNLEDADHFLGEICVTYLNFNDFKATLARRQQPLPPMPPIAIAGTALLPQWKGVLSIPALLKLKLNTRGGSAASNAVEALRSFQADDTGSAKERHPFLGYVSTHWISHTTMFQKGKSKTWGIWEKIIIKGHNLVKPPWIEEFRNESIPIILDWSKKFHHYALIRLILLNGMLSSLDRGRLIRNAAVQEDIVLLDILLEDEKPSVMIDQACEVAAQLGHLVTLERLLAAGADGQIALQAAALSGQQRAIASLLAAGTDGQIALQQAILGEDVSVITSLLDAGVDGRPLLQASIEKKDITTARTLLDAGVDGRPLLQASIEKKDITTARTLLDAGVDGQPLMQAAIERHDQDVIKLLLAAGLNGKNALQIASQRGHINIVEILLASDSRVNIAYTWDIEFALYAASRWGHIDIVDRLLDAGAFLVGRNGRYSRSALKGASEGGHLNVVERLLAVGASVNTYDRTESPTALQAACQGGHFRVVKRLLAAGADVHETGMSGTALQAASKGGHLDVVEVLLTAAFKVNTPENSQMLRIALQSASQGGHLDVVERLLAVGADINVPVGSNAPTALQLAADSGHTRIVSRLKQAGAKE